MKNSILIAIFIFICLCDVRMLIEVCENWKKLKNAIMTAPFNLGKHMGREKGRADVYSVLTDKEYLDIRKRLDKKNL